MSEVLLQETDAGVRTLTLNRPAARNALGDGLAGALYDALLAADEDDEVRVVVLTGADPAFCAGLDLKEAARDSAAYSRQFAEKNCISQVVAGQQAGDRRRQRSGVHRGTRKSRSAATSWWRPSGPIFADTHVRVGVLPGGG